MNKETVLVFTATGNIGKPLCKYLLEKGFKVKAATRNVNGDEVQKLAKDGCEIVYVDWKKPDTIDAALVGVDKVWMNATFTPQFREESKAIADACGRAKSHIKFICKLSTMEVGKTKDPISTWHETAEGYIKATGIPAAFVRPNGFSQNIGRIFGKAIRITRSFPNPFRDGLVGYVDCRDIAAVSLETLMKPEKYKDAVLELNGPLLNHKQVADIISKVVGEPISCWEISRPKFKELAIKNTKGSVPPEVFDIFVEMIEKVIDTGVCAVTNDTVQRVLGRPPISFEQYVRDYADLFRPYWYTKPRNIIGLVALVVAAGVGYYYSQVAK
jgi:uncharacterized protein YbjT (DUF2867 family)